MNRTILIAGIITLLALNSAVASIAGGGVCLTLAECKTNSTSLMNACCKTGITGTCKTCPTGWTLNAGMCTRASTTGTDASGTYTIEYGSCEPTDSTCDCYELTTSAAANNRSDCETVR